MKFLVSLTNCLIVMYFFSGCALAGPASSAGDILSTDSLVLKSGKTRDGKSLLRTIESTIKKATDYIYSSTLTTYKNGRKIRESGKFFFKDPNLVRFEVAKGGKRGGSIVVKQPNGKIKAKAGGILGALTVSLSPNSKLLFTANGYNVLHSDFETLLEATQKKVKPGHTCVATISPCSFPGEGKVHLVEVIGLDNKVIERLVLDPVKLLPKEWILFKHAKIYSVTRMTQIKLNANISTDLFVLEKGGDVLANAKSFEMLRLAESGNLGSLPVTMKLLLDLKKMTNSLREQAANLESIDSTAFSAIETASEGGSVFDLPGDSNGASAKGRSHLGFQRLLVCSAKMELILDKLKMLSDKMKEVDMFSGKKYSIYSRWNTVVNRADASVDVLLDQFERDNPDVSKITGAANKLKKDAADFDGIISDAMRAI